MARTVRIQVDGSKPGHQVNPNVYGHFAEHLGRGIYEGLWVGEDSPIPNTRGVRNDVLEALKQLDIPVLRWPGGCFADEYHWMDGIGPREDRPTMINTHWGGVTENNHFGTHEFLDLCDMLGCAPYISGNLGSGSPQEMMQWVEYITSGNVSPMADLRRKNGREEPWKLPYFGVGNENWGCGGNMRPEYYADEYRRYNTFVKNYSGNRVYRIACGANSGDVRWTEVLMDRARDHMDGLSYHYYSVLGGWPPKGSATDFGTEEYWQILRAAERMDEFLQRHIAAMDKVDPEKKVDLIVDEWGTWMAQEPGSTPGFLYQQNSMRDAVVAALHFHIFHRYPERVQMANIAQMVNVLQAMVLTDGPRMLRTPTYWVFEMFKGHQGGTVLPTTLGDAEAFSASSTQRDGRTLVSVANHHPTESVKVEIAVSGLPAARLSGRVLSGERFNAHNTFDQPDQVKPGVWMVSHGAGDVVTAELPPASVATLELAG